MGKNRVRIRKSSQMIMVALTVLALLIPGLGTVQASVLNSCSSYCHGMPPRDSIRKANPHFNSQSSAFLGNHRNHLPVAAVAADCSACHNPVLPTAFDHQTDIINMVNSLKGYSSATIRAKYDKGNFFNQTSIPNLSNATCSNVNCHFETKTPAWGANAYTAPANCNSCHGFPPAGTSGAPAGGLAGSHPRHESYFPGTTGCQKCHPAYTGFIHATSAGRPLKIQGFLRDPLNVLETSGLYSGAGTNYLPSRSGSQLFGTCSNLYCHSTGQSVTGAGAGTTVTTTTWGSSTNCGSCHANMSTNAAATGSHAAHAQSSGTVYACDVCHGAGYGAAAVNVATHVNKLINLAFTGNAVGTTYATKGTAFIPGSAVYSSCITNNCHGAMNPTWGANTAKARCQKCHGYRSSAWNALNGATGTADAKTGTHFNHISSAGTLKYAKPFSCAECHLNSSSLATDNLNAVGHIDTAGPAEVSFGALANTRLSSPTYSAPVCAANYCHGANMTSNVSNPPASRVASPTWNAPFLGVASVVGNGSTTPGSGDCSKCHGYPPMTATHAGKIATSCAGCHSHVNASGTGFIDASMHINGVVEAVGGDCLSCHSQVQGARAAVAGQFASQSHHVQGGETVTSAQCYKCHWEARTDGSIDSAYHSSTAGKGVSLVVWNGITRPVIATMGTTYISYTANGSRRQIAKLNQHCLSCHNSAGIPAANLFGIFASDQYSPEPKMLPALAKTSILSRYSSTRTVPWSLYNNTMQNGELIDYGTNRKSSTIKAISAHGNAVKNQFPAWNATLNGTGEDETMADIASATLSTNRNVFCYDCHNSHGSDAAGITSSYSSATGRYKGGLLKSTVAGQGGYSVTYKPAARTINYKAYSTLATTTATFNAGASICHDCHNNDTRKVNISRPWSIINTYSSTRPIVGYWSTPYFDNYTGTPAKRFPYKGGGPVNGIKDLRKPMGGHFASSIIGARASHTSEINGLCTPCHDPHGVSSSMTAVNRGKSVPLLKGTWITSPYREDKATPVIKRGGGSNFTGVAAIAGMPGYNIDQNTLVALPAAANGGGAAVTAKSNRRAQVFSTFPGVAGNALSLHTQGDNTPVNFAGLCLQCHTQTSLTGAAAPTTSQAWMSMNRVHQSVGGWGPTNGTNINNTVHAFTCAKCHKAHTSNLPRLAVTDCLDVRHVKQLVSGGSIPATPAATTPGFAFGNVLQSYASSAYGAGRFPAGGSRYSGTPSSAQNNGPWFFQTAQPAAVAYGSNCHNSATAGGAAYDPTKQIWNKKTRW